MEDAEYEYGLDFLFFLGDGRARRNDENLMSALENRFLWKYLRVLHGEARLLYPSHLCKVSFNGRVC